METHAKALLRVCLFAFVVAGLLLAATPVFAKSGAVLPATAKPKGYSLAAAAAATAHFNVGPRTPNTLPTDFPFQILYDGPWPDDTTFTVPRGTMFYVPVVYSDSTDSAFWTFPDVTDPQAVADYYFAPDQLGAEAIEIVVDGTVTSLGPAYAAGALTPDLPTGGDAYTVVAAFLEPLKPGTHEVTIRGRLSGAFLGGELFEFELSYTVIVTKGTSTSSVRHGSPYSPW